MKLGKLIILITILTIFAGFTTAYQEDFKVFTGNNLNDVCACNIVEQTLFLQNLGDVTSTYTISMGEKGAQWSNYAPNTFYLDEGQIEEVTQFINIPCDARGEQKLNTKVTTMFGLEKEIEQTINVKNCANIFLTQKNFPANTCPCTPVTYEYEIMNLGNHLETYKITTNKKEITVSDPIVILTPGEKRTIYAFAKLSCSEYGNVEFEVTAKAEKTKYSATLTSSIIIDKCYDYELNVNKEYTVCMNVENKIPISINNTANIANKYKISIEGTNKEKWASIDNQTLILNGQQNGFSNLVFSPEENKLNVINETIQTEYNFLIKTITERGNLEKTENITINLENCYDVNIVPKQEKQWAIQGWNESYPVLIENIGTKSSTYLLNFTNNPEWAMLDAQTLTLAPGENKEINIIAQVPNKKESSKTTISATIPEFDLTREKTLIIETEKTENAFELNIETKNQRITNNTFIEIPITQVGIREASYSLELYAPSFITSNNNYFTLQPGENTTIVLNAIPGNISEKYEIILEINAVGTEVYYVNDFSLAVNQPTLGEKIINNIWIIVGIILLILLITLSIFGIKKQKENGEEKTFKKEVNKLIKEKETEKKKSKWWIFLIAGLILLAIVFAVFSFTTPMFANNNKTNSTTNVLEEIELITEPQDFVKLEQDKIELGTSTETKMELTNPTDKIIVYEINTNTEWVVPTVKELYLKPQETKKVILQINPTENLEENNYVIDITTEIRGETIQQTETEQLTISKEYKITEQFWFWAIVGLLIAITIITIITLKPKKEKKKKEKQQKLIKKTNNKLKILLGILGIIVIGLLIWYVFSANNSNTENLTLETNKLYVENELQVIELTVFNDYNNSAIITLGSSDNSAQIQDQIMQVNSNTKFTTKITVNTSEEKEIEIASLFQEIGSAEEKTETKTLQITKKSMLNSIIIYILIGIIFAILAITIIINTDKPKAQQEIKVKEKRTNIGLKKK